MKSIQKAGVVLYDYLLVPGGAEAVALFLARHLGNPLCVSFRAPHYIEASADELDQPDIIVLGVPSRHAVMRILVSLWRFRYRTRFLDDYETVIYTGNQDVVAIHNHQHGRNILYCHTPPRFVYDLRGYWMSQIPFWQRPFLRLVVSLLKTQYERALNKMDIIVVNSENVRSRMKEFLNVDSCVIYPPVETGKFSWLGQKNYYLSTARLERLKRVDKLVEAFKLMPEKKLIVASGGSELENLKKLAKGHSNIEFTGWVEPEKLKELVGNCIATLYIPVNEDFGISPVESMAAGKPVIGVSNGGLLESVKHGNTGYLIDEKGHGAFQSLEISSIVKAVQWLNAERALTMRKPCEAQALQFDKSVFLEKISSILKA